MPNLPDYSWPPMDQRRGIGKPTKRRDGPEKSTGRAKYSSDLKPPGMLFGALLTSPYAHARITSIDTSEAEHIAGVTAVRVMTAHLAGIYFCCTSERWLNFKRIWERSGRRSS